jgi:hypothetical protein
MSGQPTDARRFAGTPLARLSVRASLSALASVAVNLGLVFAAVARELAPGFRPLAAPPVVVLTVAAIAGATGVYGVLRSRSATPARTFRRVAAIVLLASWVPDLGLLIVDETATAAGVAVLMAMHAVVAAACVALLPGESR